MANPFQDVDLDVIVRDPDGLELQVPAYWAGALTWRGPDTRRRKPGRYTWRSISTDTANAGLSRRAEAHSRRLSYVARIRCYRHGPLRVLPRSSGTSNTRTYAVLLAGRYLVDGIRQALDGPRISNAGRRSQRKGFTVVQIVADFIPTCRSEIHAGRTKRALLTMLATGQINPGYFDRRARSDPASGGERACRRASSAAGATICRFSASRDEKALEILDREMGRHIFVSGAWRAREQCRTIFRNSRTKMRWGKRPRWTELAKYVRSLKRVQESDYDSSFFERAHHGGRSRVLDFRHAATTGTRIGSIPGTVAAVNAIVSAAPAMAVRDMARFATKAFKKPAVRKCSALCSGRAC